MAKPTLMAIMIARSKLNKTAPASVNAEEKAEGAADSPMEEAAEDTNPDAGDTQPGTFAHHAAKAAFHNNLMNRKMKRTMPVHAKLALHHAMKAIDCAPGMGSVKGGY